MKDRNKLSLNMRYAGIKASKFFLYEGKSASKLVEDPLFEFQTGIQFKIFEEDQQIGCLVNVKILLLQTNEEFAELQVENRFEIKPFEEVVNKTGEDKYGVSDAVIINLASISVSTVRGILHEKLKGTIAQNEIFPLIDVSNFQKGGAISKEKDAFP